MLAAYLSECESMQVFKETEQALGCCTAILWLVKLSTVRS